jgi:crooked neck
MQIPDNVGSMGQGEDEYKKPKLTQVRVPPVKDKSTNPIQITAELILKDPNMH